jgi:DNA-binding phage protein
LPPAHAAEIACPLWLNEVPPRRVSVVDLASETQLGRQVLAFNDDEVIELLRAAIEREGGQTAYARRHGLERTGVNMILRRKRPVSDAVMKSLGLRKLYVSE